MVRRSGPSGPLILPPQPRPSHPPTSQACACNRHAGCTPSCAAPPARRDPAPRCRPGHRCHPLGRNAASPGFLPPRPRPRECAVLTLAVPRPHHGGPPLSLAGTDPRPQRSLADRRRVVPRLLLSPTPLTEPCEGQVPRAVRSSPMNYGDLSLSLVHALV